MRGACSTMVLAAALSACAWDAGEPFATLTPHLDAGLVIPDDRDLGMGWQALASSYEVRIDALALEAGELGLIGGATGGARFDPASPPDGYSLCHNGHCHSDDGRLVDYEDIERELAQGGSDAATVMILPVGTLDLIAGVSTPLDCVPSCDLPLTTIGAVNLDVTRLQARGLIRDGRATPRIEGEIPWIIDVGFADPPLMLSSAIDLPADREHAPDVALHVNVAVTSALLDDIAWADLTVGPIGGVEDGYDVTGADASREAVVTRLGELRLELQVTR